MALHLLGEGDKWQTLATPGKHNDGGGLYLDVRSATSASWVFKYTFGGKVDEIGLGSRKLVTVGLARELRAKYADAVARGDNPKKLHKDAKLETVRAANAPKGASIHELARNHISVIALRLKTEAGREEWVRSLHADRIGYIADMAPQDVTLEDVRPMLEAYYKCSPVMAKTVRERLCRVIQWAHGADMFVAPEGWRNPAAWALLRDKLTEQGQDHEEEHHASLPHEEIGLFVNRVQGVNDRLPALKLALEWDIISATRPGEAFGANWSEIDWTADCWVIPARRTKMRRIHRVPLTDRHHALLAMLLPPGATEAPRKGKLFPGLKAGKSVSMTGVRQVMQSIRKPDGSAFVAAKEMPDDADEEITLHGFRTSFRTWAQSEVYPVTLPNGKVQRVELYSDVLIEEALAHKVGNDVRNAYLGKGGDTMERRRDLMAGWAEYVGTVREEKVVQFPRMPRAA